MPQLTIPEEYVAGLGHIVVLPDEAIRELTAALSESQAALDITDPSGVTSLISGKVPAIPTKELRPIMAALLSLYVVHGASEVSAEQFLNDVMRAMKRSRRPELAIDDPNIDKKVRDRLKALLGLGALTAASKAVVLQHDHEHTLCTARIFTDARPVYGDDVAAPPSAVVLTHMLKLTYHEGNKLEEIHIAFDKADLLNLKSLIARAETKASGLKKIFDAGHIPVME